ncbi:hypothetical protein [Novosphingobium sp.]|uniref:hypothetical protein n=1 Tax=Novosphingobium sp. TaxID=1874826 RepID=UPI003BAD12DA
MHIHPPKPLHGWKEFLNEIFVIVIGVLIALGFEQVVEQWHWHHEIADARETLRTEVARDLLAMQIAIDNQQCRDANWGELQRRVKVNDPAGVLALVALWPKLQGQSITLDSTHWELANNSGLLAHMPTQEKQALANAFGIFGIEERFQRNRADLILEAISKASVFEGSTNSRESLLEKIALLRKVSGRADNYPNEITEIRKKTGIEPATPDEVKRESGLIIRPCVRFDQIAKAS